MSHAVCSVASSMSRPLALAMLVPIFAAITAAILLGLLGVFVVWLCIVAVLITAIVAPQWRRVRQTEAELRLKQEMVTAGYSAEDIERIVRASSQSTSTDGTAVSVGRVP